MAALIGILRKCKKCDEEKDLSKFSKQSVSADRPDRNKYFRHTCNACVHKHKTPAQREQLNANGRKNRKENPAQAIYTDSRRSDKMRGFDNNLTHEFIKKAISTPCMYCGETKLRMTLDRIDNTKGHTQDNVISACVRCNYIRGIMPYEAWLMIVPALRKVRALKLFGAWPQNIPGMHG